jgi:hypothetical protein
MNRPFHLFLVLLSPAVLAVAGCDGQVKTAPKTSAVSANKTSKAFKEGSDYFLFERVRILDKTAFAKPEEAYSILLPKGWQHQSNIIWNQPGTTCAGTFRWIKATSPDGKSSIEMLPDVLYGWSSDPQLMQFNQNNSGSSANCTTGKPVNAEEYLRTVFGPNDLGNPEILKVTTNDLVVQQMQQSNEKTRTELMQYGSAGIQFYQSAINGSVRWADGTEGLVVLGTSIMENTVPNVYNGTSNKIYTTQVTQRTVFKYAAGQRANATNQFSMIMASFRTNPGWNDAVNSFWKDVRQKRQIAHIGTIKMIDAQTRAIGNRAVQNGEARLRAMDTDQRSWEQSQSSQDRMHTNFIKTIREVENYRDETGKIELTSGYDHAWSRSDGSTFIMSNSPNFDPSSVFQDQSWKEMKKVD